MSVRIRASGLADFFDCPARAEAKHLRGLRTPMGVKALVGKAIHKSTAVYDQGVIDRADLTIDDAAGAAVDVFKQPGEDVVYEEDDNPKQLEGIALALHGRYCREIAPTQEYAAVEVTCDNLEIVDLGITLTGQTDRVAKVDDGHGIRDLKSGATAVGADGTVATKGHAFQLGVYELIAERASGIPINAPAKVIGLQTGKTERGQRVAVSGDVIGARDVLVGDQDSPGVLQMLGGMLRSGVFPGNPRSMLCHEKYCPIYNRCKFRR